MYCTFFCCIQLMFDFSVYSCLPACADCWVFKKELFGQNHRQWQLTMDYWALWFIVNQRYSMHGVTARFIVDMLSLGMKDTCNILVWPSSMLVSLSQVRKAAQEAVTVLLKKTPGDMQHHPASATTAKFCVQQIEEHGGKGSPCFQCELQITRAMNS